MPDVYNRVMSKWNKTNSCNQASMYSNQSIYLNKFTDSQHVSFSFNTPFADYSVFLSHFVNNFTLLYQNVKMLFPCMYVTKITRVLE